MKPKNKNMSRKNYIVHDQQAVYLAIEVSELGDLMV